MVCVSIYISKTHSDDIIIIITVYTVSSKGIYFMILRILYYMLYIIMYNKV